MNMREELYAIGYFIQGDSAYEIDSFLLPPYDYPNPKSSKVKFNFYHSSARITVECAFGEIDLRWGIFWKKLKCDVEHASFFIEGAMRIHIFVLLIKRIIMIVLKQEQKGQYLMMILIPMDNMQWRISKIYAK